MVTYTTPAGSYPRLYSDILQQPHTLIAGATGSGKSIVINGLIHTALYSAPNEKQLVLIDPKRVELIAYTDLPHTALYACETTDIIYALSRSIDLMEYRYQTMQKQRLKRYIGSDIYIFIDEYADLITTAKKAVFPMIARLAQLGRAAGVHLIIATQRPTREIVNGQIKVNVDSRLALRCPTAQDSRNIINQSGAESLPRYGQGYYLTPDTMYPVLVDIPMIPDIETQRIINHWKNHR